ncbi:prohibitin family protein [Treponema sp.]|uniref:prohibitin family protein n=1 Tax=Treponema sp. TaxID=166 RepID=UPI00298E7B56|nr:prohibitin family protein [Treponema sp.]MCR5612399.1 prohibitin family protein [Treponema sp.]
MDKKAIKNLCIAGAVALVLVVVTVNSCTIVSPNERGVKVTLGQVEGEVIQPGMKFHAPFITIIRKFRLEPKTYEVSFSCGQDGAITKDMQTVGSTVAVRYIYDERRIMDIVTRYQNDQVIQSAMRDNVKASLKETVGQYSIYDLVEKQNEVTTKVAQAMLTRMADYPIDISQTTITNWDWSDDFDKQIKETANRAQEVKKAEQDLKLAEQQAQKQVKEAEAKKAAAEQEAEAELIKAQKAAEAKRVEADAIAYYNAKIAQNYNVEIKLKELEIELERAKRWDGRQVPEYVPLTAAGGIVNLPPAKN